MSRLRVRLLFLVFLALSPIAGLVIYTAIEQRATAMAEARSSALRMVRLAAAGQKQHIESGRQLLATLAQLSEVREADLPACETLFTNLLNLHHVYANMGITDTNGNLIVSGIPGEGLSLGDSAYFARLRETLKFAVGDYEIGPITGKPTVNLAYPIRDPSGKFSGVLFAALDLHWLNQLIARADLPDRSTLTAIDRRGTIVLRYPDRGGRYAGQSVTNVPGIVRILASNKEDTGKSFNLDSVKRIYAYTPLNRTEGIADSWVLVGIPAEAALAPAVRTLLTNLIYLALVTLLAAGAAWFGGDFFILRRVRALVAATRRLAAGDLTARAGAAGASAEAPEGELGELARAFDEMAESLEQRVAERQRAEAELKTLNEQLEQRVTARTVELKRSNEDLEQFAYVASHDLQEPLRMITSYMQLLRQRYIVPRAEAPVPTEHSTTVPMRKHLDADAEEFIAFALDGSERMQRLIIDLLTYSRIGTKAKPMVPTDTNEVLGRALRNLTIAIEESGARITHDPLPVIPGDSVQLTQLFKNLIGNAIKFRADQSARPEGLQIKIGAKPEQAAWHFTIQDNGIGIPKKDFERIFIIFQRLHTRDKYQGTGIGLSICKKIVDRHRGRIWVESEEGIGTTFHFVLPTRTQSAEFTI